MHTHAICHWNGGLTTFNILRDFLAPFLARTPPQTTQASFHDDADDYKHDDDDDIKKKAKDLPQGLCVLGYTTDDCGCRDVAVPLLI